MRCPNANELNIFQNDNLGTLSLNMKKSYYFTGEELSGSIFINTLQDIDIDHYSLELKLQMQEKWRFGSEIDHYRSDSNIQNLIELKIDIQSSLPTYYTGEKCILRKGTYNFPFNTIIPIYFQPSFEFNGISNANIHLRYIVYSCLLSTEGENYSLSNLSYLIIKSRLNYIKTEHLITYSSCVNLRSWMVFERGTCKLNVSLPKNKYTYGEFIDLRCNIDNSRSKLKVKKLKGSLMQKISFKNKKRDIVNLYENELQSKYLELDISQFSSPVDIQMKFLVHDNFKNNTNLYSTMNDAYTLIFKKSEDVFQFQSTINSILIHCEYFIKLSLHYSSYVSYSYRPRVYLPVTITHQVNPEKISNDFSDRESISDKLVYNNVSNSSMHSNQYEDINTINLDYSYSIESQYLLKKKTV